MDLRKDFNIRQADKCGEINFGIEYDFISETLKLRIIQVSDWGGYAIFVVPDFR